MSGDVLHRLSIRVPQSSVDGMEAAIEPFCCAVMRLLEPGGTVRVEGLAPGTPDRRALDLALALAAAAAGLPLPDLLVEPLAERDWLAENRERFAAFRVGRFRVQEPEDGASIPPALIALRIEAASAFGSGRHASTEGCLRALSLLAPRTIRRPIDIGCGSGILAIAAAKLWRAPVLASDIDPSAVAVTRANARLNGVGSLVRAVTASGWRSPTIAARAPFDLVLANILARPLKRMAGDLVRHLAPGGTAVLAGLLGRDGADVLAAYRAHGLVPERTLMIDGWPTLILRQPRRAASKA